MRHCRRPCRRCRYPRRRYGCRRFWSAGIVVRDGAHSRSSAARHRRSDRAGSHLGLDLWLRRATGGDGLVLGDHHRRTGRRVGRSTPSSSAPRQRSARSCFRQTTSSASQWAVFSCWMAFAESTSSSANCGRWVRSACRRRPRGTGRRVHYVWSAGSSERSYLPVRNSMCRRLNCSASSN